MEIKTNKGYKTQNKNEIRFLINNLKGKMGKSDSLLETSEITECVSTSI